MVCKIEHFEALLGPNISTAGRPAHVWSTNASQSI